MNFIDPHIAGAWPSSCDGTWGFHAKEGPVRRALRRTWPASAAIVTTLLVMACGASFSGPANSSAGDRCNGHLDCGAAGCCMSAPFDAEDWTCLPPNARTANGYPRGVCEYVGGYDPGDPNIAAKPPVPTCPSSSSMR